MDDKTHGISKCFVKQIGQYFKYCIFFVYVCWKDVNSIFHFVLEAAKHNSNLLVNMVKQENFCFFFIWAVLIEEALTSQEIYWSPAVQHWSCCVFWCTGPECDVISLLRQERQARPPPSGHWPLTWTESLYVIITGLVRRAQLTIELKSSGEKSLESEGETWALFGEESSKGLDRKKQTSAASELIRFVTSDGTRWQRSWHLYCHSVSTALSIGALGFFKSQSDLETI